MDNGSVTFYNGLLMVKFFNNESLGLANIIMQYVIVAYRFMEVLLAVMEYDVLITYLLRQLYERAR